MPAKLHPEFPIVNRDLRHIFATRLVRAGVDFVPVQHLAEHSTISKMMRYAHSLADDKIAAVRRLDRSNVLSASALGL
jgi:site-specific recombinase XerD